MRFSHPSPRRPSEPALPMINVVFLLLIFFLMSAQITPPAPIDVTPPSADRSQAADAEAELALYVTADGTLVFEQAQDDAAWEALRNVAVREEFSLLIFADADLPANQLASLLSRLGALGLGEVFLVAQAE